MCLNLLTKEESFDLEASDGLEREILVNCFSLVLERGMRKSGGMCIRGLVVVMRPRPF